MLSPFYDFCQVEGFTGDGLGARAYRKNGYFIVFFFNIKWSILLGMSAVVLSRHSFKVTQR